MNFSGFVAVLLQIAAVAAGGMPGAQAADTFKGREVYAAYCQNCHGEDGRGVVAGAPDFSRGQGLMTADATLAQGLRLGKGAMPAYQGILRDEQLLDVLAYLRAFHR